MTNQTRVNIYLSEDLLGRVDAFAATHGMKRSSFVGLALTTFMDKAGSVPAATAEQAPAAPVLTDFGWWLPKPGETERETRLRAADEWKRGGRGISGAEMRATLSQAPQP